MKYFANIKNLVELKKQYRKLALANHPDAGGKEEDMKEINIEYDIMFNIYKNKVEKETGEPVKETAESTRSEFYTQNGWKGDNYNPGTSLKDIAKIVREYIKEKYSNYKFSVRTSYASMCQELHVELKEAPERIYKTFEELTSDDKHELINRMIRRDVFKLSSWNNEELKEEFERVWNELGDHSYNYKIMTEKIQEVVKDVDNFVNSYNRSDCDGMIDYFDVNFYYFGCCQDNGRDIKVVPREEKPDIAEYEYKKVTKTVIKKENRVEESDGSIKDGQCFVLKVRFNHGCNKGYVYRIHEKDDRFVAVKLNKKLDKECTGNIRGNVMFYYATEDEIMKWITKGSIAFCKIVQVETPCTVEKTVRVKKTKEKKEPENKKDKKDTPMNPDMTFKITKGEDTRDGSILWIARIQENLSKEKFQDVNEAIKKNGGYYSKFKHGFIFRVDPTNILKGVK